jgi:hypothetical protein
MANALKKPDFIDASVTLDVNDALQAAIVRAMEVGAPERTIMDYISKDEWQNMDSSHDQICVFDPE